MSDKQINNRQRKAPKTAFKPGQSGNPKGRPKKDSAISAILNKIGDQKYKGNITKREQLLKVAYDLAIGGSMPHLQFIADRTEGRAIERIMQERVKDTIIIE